MGTKQYQLGLKHGREGVRHLAHRKLRPYDSRSAMRSYTNGYSTGCKERMDKGKLLDYSNPLNNQWFGDKP